MSADIQNPYKHLSPQALEIMQIVDNAVEDALTPEQMALIQARLDERMPRSDE
jgi:Spy/CpxP family protein refolding chaperone